jgi:hypothetical protein
MTLDRYTRWQAAPIHLLISAVIATLVVGTMLLVWYPQPYFLAAGGITLVLLLVGVDVVLGPLLTLIVFDPKKKSLKIDLAIIAALQLAALAYGGWTMFSARPVYVAFAGDRFHLVAANEISPADLDKAAIEYRSLPLAGPKLVGTKPPDDPGERENLRVAMFMGGTIGLFPQYYVPYSAVARDVVASSKTLATLRQKNPDRVADIDAYIAASGKPENALRYLPMRARRDDVSVIVDPTNGDVQGVLAVDPW